MSPLRPLLLATAAALALAHPAGAQPERRLGADRQLVVRLAYVLGEAHALHRLCAGAADATWYDRMQRLLGQESTSDASRRQLVESFNSGFAASQAQFQSCGPRSQAAEHDVAEQGRALALQLAGSGEQQ